MAKAKEKSMANSTDPFGKSVFGGGTTLGAQGPGMTSAAAQPGATAAKTNPYKYAGSAGYQDPLAQQLY
jgi:hypothetical protein